MILRIHIRTAWTAVARWTSHLLLGGGALVLALVLWTQIDSALYQAVQARQFAAAVEEEATAAPRPPEAPVPVSRASSTRGQPQPLFGGLDSMLIGRFEIPRLGLTAMVREGMDPVTLRRAIGHVPGTALPGQMGNFVLAAHRDSFFRGLRFVQKGDEIRVRTRDGAFVYRVTGLSVVDPSNTEPVRSTEAAVCTLVTCFPFDYVGPAPRRYIVRAEMTR